MDTFAADSGITLTSVGVTVIAGETVGDDPSGGLSTGALIAIIAGCLVFGVGVGVTAYCLCCRERGGFQPRSKYRSSKTSKAITVQEVGMEMGPVIAGSGAKPSAHNVVNPIALATLPKSTE